MLFTISKNLKSFVYIKKESVIYIFIFNNIKDTSGEINKVAFDKTGTLTETRLKLKGVVGLNDASTKLKENIYVHFPEIT